ncbi:MAG: transcription termination factor NusA [Planctomycetota bacterium]
MDKEILRMVEVIHREKNIDKDIIFKGLENAIQSVAAKKHPFTEAIQVTVDRESGSLAIAIDGDLIDPMELGWIAAQNVYQIIMQKIKEAGNEVIFIDYKKKEQTLVSGTVRRIEKNNILVGIGDIDGILPGSEQVKGERYQLGERIRCLIKAVKKENVNITVLLSRTDEGLVRRLFELEIPEIAGGIITIKGIVRTPGVRSKVAVDSSDKNIDCIGACVGVNGSRIYAIIKEIDEKIDIIRWDADPRVFIANALSPAAIASVDPIPAIQYARVIVARDQVPLTIGKGGLNIRLSSRLTGWALDVFDTDEIRTVLAQGDKELEALPGVGRKIHGALVEHNIRTLENLIAFGPDRLQAVKGVFEEGAWGIIVKAKEMLEARQASEEEVASADKQPAE